jgi:hypothetical protein
MVSASPADAGEIMTDRCSAEAAIAPSYTARPNSRGAVVLRRGPNGWSPWSQPFRVALGPDGHIRWWCRSTTGNYFDPGTWRIEEAGAGVRCSQYADGQVSGCRPDGRITIGSSAWEGWTPERSRCGDRSTRVRARLGPNRLLQIECLGR